MQFAFHSLNCSRPSWNSKESITQNECLKLYDKKSSINRLTINHNLFLVFFNVSQVIQKTNIHFIQHSLLHQKRILPADWDAEIVK